MTGNLSCWYGTSEEFCCITKALKNSYSFSTMLTWSIQWQKILGFAIISTGTNQQFIQTIIRIRTLYSSQRCSGSRAHPQREKYTLYRAPFHSKGTKHTHTFTLKGSLLDAVYPLACLLEVKGNQRYSENPWSSTETEIWALGQPRDFGALLQWRNWKSSTFLFVSLCVVDYLKDKLDAYMSQFPKVRIIRLKERHGLIRARLAGAAQAKGKHTNKQEYATATDVFMFSVDY